MKNFLTNLLIGISLCLCVLIWFQWLREGHMRQKVQALTDTIHDRDEAIQNLQAASRGDRAEISRLDGLKNELTATVKTTRLEIAKLTKDMERANAEIEKQLKQVDAYKDALERANESIKKQNDDIKRQNEEMKTLADERNEVVTKFNKVVADFNDLAAKWNALQETLSKTNAPPAHK